MYDAIVVGGGHNGLTCAAYLARACGCACSSGAMWRASYVVSVIVHERGVTAVDAVAAA